MESLGILIQKHTLWFKLVDYNLHEFDQYIIHVQSIKLPDKYYNIYIRPYIMQTLLEDTD